MRFGLCALYRIHLNVVSLFTCSHLVKRRGCYLVGFLLVEWIIQLPKGHINGVHENAVCVINRSIVHILYIYLSSSWLYSQWLQHGCLTADEGVKPLHHGKVIYSEPHTRYRSSRSNMSRNPIVPRKTWTITPVMPVQPASGKHLAQLIS